MSMQAETTGLKVAILIVSDTAHDDPTTDKSGKILSAVFKESKSISWTIYETKIVPDVSHLIQAFLKQTASECNLIVTTGGTGFATKDVTPEAVEILLEKKAPGLVHGMLAASLKVTPFAMMSRPVAGVYRGAIIVTLPGSPKGAKENLEAILPLLPHACMQAAGHDSRSLHTGGITKLEADAGVGSAAASSRRGHNHAHHSHSHSHDHQASHSSGHHHGHTIPIPHTQPQDMPQASNDPSLGPSRRYRESPYPMLKVHDAVLTIMKNVPSPRIVSKAVSPQLCYHILAEDVMAKEAVPAFRASIVDGYAVELPANGGSQGIFEVASVSNASPSHVKPLEQGKIARITTGAPLPPNATSVVMVEDTLLKSTSPDGEEELQIEILTNEVKPGENVREVGSDVALGDIILKKGEVISPTGGELGLLASTGVSEIKVYERPTVGVMSTGDEIVPHDHEGPLRLGEVRDCNRMTLMSAFQSWGFCCVDLGIGPDDVDALEQRIRESLGRCDVLITSGGASMGERDLLKPVLERRLAATIHFGRVAMKPGKPTSFSTVEVKDPSTGNKILKPVFSLPGNPASAVVSAGIFALPGLTTMAGRVLAQRQGEVDAESVNYAGLPRVQVTLKEAVRGDKNRDEYVRASLYIGEGGRLMAQTTGGQRSSRIGSLARANGLLVLPAAGGEIPSGQVVDCLLIGQIADL